MSNVPAELKYTDEHEWIRTEADGTLTIGITDHAQTTLGDIVFLELPKVGSQVKAGDAVGVVESVKAASDIYSPVTGEVIAINTDVADAPEEVNGDARVFEGSRGCADRTSGRRGGGRDRPRASAMGRDGDRARRAARSGQRRPRA